MGKKPARGDNAPEFRLPDDREQLRTLKSYAGHKLVLYFYPNDDTSGCTREAVDFSALKAELHKADAAILGVSPDSPQSHDKFKSKHGLSIDLASDSSRDVCEAYGVWTEKSMYGRKFMGVERTTFLIGRDGKIAEIWNKVRVPGHAEAVLTAVRALP
ncbi:MAG TPA: peroxiredoxin [Methylovirgula sp.]